MRINPVLPLLACLSLVVGLLSPAAADPLPHGNTPLIVNLRPAPGQLLAEGATLVAALATADDPVERAAIAVDGEEIAASSSGGTHTTVGASVKLSPGRHVAEVVASTGAGESRRAWAFFVSGSEVERLAGRTRLETAVAVSEDLFPVDGAATSALLARSDHFADALAAAPFARQHDGPILLSPPDRLAPTTAEELQRLLRDGATVYLLGGPGALHEQVADDVRALGFEVRRVSGNDRYATSAALADRLAPADSAVVVSGETFADALTAAAAAAARGYPVLLTARDALPAEAGRVLREGDFETVLLVGGAEKVSDTVERQVQEAAGGAQVVRIGGSSAYDTSVNVARTFFPAYDTVAIAAGDTFPDALAAGAHAPARQAPLLLVPPQQLTREQVVELGAHAPDTAIVYGGRGAVDDGVVAALRRAVASAGAPVVTDFSPAGGIVPTLEEVVVTFDGTVKADDAIMYVTVAGHEVAGRVNAGDLQRELVFTVERLPEGLRAEQNYPITVTVAAHDGDNWRFAERHFAYSKPFQTLSRGDSGPEVRRVQEQLSARGYWLGTPHGQYDYLTHQAVLAFQKVHGLARDGVYGAQTRSTLEGDAGRPQARSSEGLVVEVDKTHQVVLVVHDGRVLHVFNSSTGTGEPYEYAGRTYIADTPPGSFRIGRQIDGWRESHLGRLWRPKYFNGGIALHGSHSVPAYPASHGCVRVSIEAMNFLWDRIGIGTRVLVY